MQHCVDANVGLHFAHVGRLDLLREHYGDDLVVVESVAQEWVRRASKQLIRPSRGAAPAERAAYDRDVLVRAASRLLMVARQARSTTGDSLEEYQCSLGEPVELPQELAGQLEGARAALMDSFGLDPDDEHAASNYGECACILYLRAGRGPTEPAEGAILTNDWRADSYARLRGVRRRSTREVLDQIVSEGRLGLTASTADELHERMTEVSQVSPKLRP